MEEVRVQLPDGESLTALRLQDLPAEHVIAFLGMPPGFKEQMSVRMLQLAVGKAGVEALYGLTFGELEQVLDSWLTASAESEERDSDGRGDGIDWSGFLV